jgi:hypothetical protein
MSSHKKDNYETGMPLAEYDRKIQMLSSYVAYTIGERLDEFGIASESNLARLLTAYLCC